MTRKGRPAITQPSVPRDIERRLTAATVKELILTYNDGAPTAHQATRYGILETAVIETGALTRCSFCSWTNWSAHANEAKSPPTQTYSTACCTSLPTCTHCLPACPKGHPCAI